MTAAPDLYGVNDDELHDELQRIDQVCTVDLEGVTVTAGVRRDPLGGPDHPVIVVRGASGLHVLALPGDNVP